MRRDQKEQLREELNLIFSKANNAVILSFSKFTVNDVNNLRRKLRESNCNYKVIKNRIAKIAAKGTPMEQVIDLFEGVTAIAYTFDDEPSKVAKLLKEVQKDLNVFEFKGFIVDGEPYKGDHLDMVASLPSRVELITKFAIALQYPIVTLARLLKAPVRDIALVFSEVGKKKNN